MRTNSVSLLSTNVTQKDVAEVILVRKGYKTNKSVVPGFTI